MSLAFFYFTLSHCLGFWRKNFKIVKILNSVLVISLFKAVCSLIFNEKRSVKISGSFQCSWQKFPFRVVSSIVQTVDRIQNSGSLVFSSDQKNSPFFGLNQSWTVDSKWKFGSFAPSIFTLVKCLKKLLGNYYSLFK